MRLGRWFDAGWYGYLWRRAHLETKIALGVLTLAVLGAGGFYLATLESSAHAAAPDAYILTRTSVVKTVVQDGHVKRIRVVRTVKVPAKAVTVDSLRTITRAGQVKKVPVTKVKYVPETKTATATATVSSVVTNVLTRSGKTTTVVNTKPVTVQNTVPVTVSQTQTQQQTVTQSQTVTTQRVSTVEVTTTVVHTTTVTQTVTEPVTTTVVVSVPLTTTKPA